MANLYRRHRPQTLAEVVGQPHVVRTLSNAIEQDRLSHAYLFVGSRGTGKTSVAKILARSLNCAQGPTVQPCGECEQCRSIASGTSLDVVEMDAASHNSVDDIRELRESVNYVPTDGRWKIYILDEAHMLSSAAWNAFLKTLEEPPPNTIFVLATTEAHKVVATIVDRCQRFDFRRPSLDQVGEVLQRVARAEQVEISDKALAMIARSATGSFRDAISTLDQLLAYCGSSIADTDVVELLGVAQSEQLFALTDAVTAMDAKTALQTVDLIDRSGGDLGQFVRDLIGHLRQLLVTQTVGRVPASFALTGDQVAQITEQATAISRERVTRTIELLGELLALVKEGADARVGLELALVKACDPAYDAGALLARIQKLEERIDGNGGSFNDIPADADHDRETIEPVPVVEEITEQQGAPAQGEKTEVSQAVGDSEVDQVDSGAQALDLAAIGARWHALVAGFHDSEDGALLGALLSEGRPVSLESGTLTVGYPQGASFLKRKAETTPVRSKLTQAVSAALGQRLVLQFELIAASPQEVVQKDAPAGEELIDLIKREFDAVELEVGPEGG